MSNYKAKNNSARACLTDDERKPYIRDPVEAGAKN